METHDKLTNGISKHALTFLGLVGLNIVMRVVPHPPNFTPLTASALFAGFFFPRLLPAFLAPMLAMIVSDWIIGGYEWHVMASVYASLALPILLCGVLRSKLTPLRVLSGALASSVTFFLTTNFAVWYFAGWYERSLAGLLQCYAAAAPFFKYTACGDLLWSAVLFGSYALLTSDVVTRLRGRLTPALSA